MSPHLGKILPPALAPIGFKDIAGGLRAMRRGGRATADFALGLKEYFQVRYCYLLSSGKASLALILRALKELHPDKDEVLIPAFTCWSVPAAIYRAGLKIRICDTEPETLDFDYRELARQLAAPRLLCVIPTHLFGVTADIPRVRELIGDRGIPIVEDAAQAMGGERSGQKAGTLGDVGFFSMERGKAFSTVKGGIIVTNSAEIGALLQTYFAAIPAIGLKEQLVLAMYAVALAIFSRPRLYSIPKSLPFLRLGETFFEPDFPIRRLSDFQAGMAAGWQDRLQESIRLRRKNSEYLSCLGIKPGCLPAALSTGLLRYPVLMKNPAEKAELLQESDRLGMGAADVYPGTVDSIAALQGSLVDGNSKKAREIVEKMITLPVHPKINTAHLRELAAMFKRSGRMSERDGETSTWRRQDSVTVLKEISSVDRLKILSLLIFWLGLFTPILPGMVQEWVGNSDNSHGFIVPFVAGYFAWGRRDRLESATLGNSWWGCLMLMLVLLAYVLSYAGGLLFPARVAMVLSLFGLIWCMLGRAAVRILAFPILFLLFMIPAPYSLVNLVSGPLQLFATKISAALIEACSIPVFRDGNMLYFVSTQLEVAEACSGIRSIIALSMLAVAFASVCQADWKGKAMLIVSAIPIAMAGNIIRVTGTGILAHFFGDQVARGFLHEFSGIAIFFLGLVALWGAFTLVNRKIPKNVQ